LNVFNKLSKVVELGNGLRLLRVVWRAEGSAAGPGWRRPAPRVT
jgi:hypothetical protein